MKLANIRTQTTMPPSMLFPATYTLIRSESKIGRNDSCPCGSGKKYKKCCLSKDTLVQRATSDSFIQGYLGDLVKKERAKQKEEKACSQLETVSES